MSAYCGRLAPSPTGALHLGNVRTFLVAWLRTRSCGGRLVMRMEDLDHPRDKPGAAAQALEDLRWLGFDWDETYVQSGRRALYREAIGVLHRAGLAYPCVCSRRDVERAQGAPHAGEQLYYPGTCRGRFAAWAEASAACAPRVPCWRFRVEPGTRVSFTDVFAGDFAQDVSSELGDFPLARDADGAGYTLAAVLDDLLMGVTEVVRGDDLLPATPAQILVARALAPVFAPGRAVAQPFAYCHVPLAVGPDGRRLAKRHGDTRVAAFRSAGWTPGRLLGWVGASCGLCPPEAHVSLSDLLATFDLSRLPRAPWVVDGRLVDGRLTASALDKGAAVGASDSLARPCKGRL